MNTETNINTDPQVIEDKILHILGIYPIISPTMLQGGLGPQIKPAQWRPILTALIKSGKVMETQRPMQTHQERFNTYALLHLSETELPEQSVQDTPGG